MAIVNATHANPGGAGEPLVSTEKLNKTLVVENVTVVEVTKRIEVPTLVEVPREQIRYVTHEEDTTKYNTVLKETVRYVPRDIETMKYVVREMPTDKYIPVEKLVEVPKFVDKEFEVPKLVEKPLEVVTIKDLDNIQKLVAAIPDVVQGLNDAVTGMVALLEDVKTAQVEVAKLRDIKLVEEVIRVPKIEWHTVEVERVVWKDITRERPN